MITRLASRPRARLLARLAPGTLLVEAERGGHVVWSTGFSFGNENELAQVLGSLAAQVPRERLPSRLVVLVSPPLVQRRTLHDLPPVRPAELNRLVARAASRFFRQNGHPLVSAAAWQENGAAPRRVAQAVAVESELAEAIVAGAEQAGLRLVDIRPDPEAPGLSLLPPNERVRRSRREWRALGRAAAAVLLLWVILGAVAAIHQLAEASRLDAELTRLAGPRAALLAARQQMDSAEDMLGALDRAQAGRSALAARLAALDRVLPESTYLTSLTLDSAGRGTAAGRTRGVGPLIDALESARALGPVRLEGATVRDSAAGVSWERFTLRFGREGSR